VRSELRQVRDAGVRDVRFVGDDHGIAVARGELEREVHPPQRARRIVRQCEEHHARAMQDDRARDRILVEREVRAQIDLDGRQAARDRGELVIDERRRRIEDRSGERVAQHRDQLVRSISEHDLLARDRELLRDDRPQRRCLRIGIPLERHLAQRSREWRPQLRR
jgi:hypothetical protein